ncbi:MAG: hypothetical protein R3279_06455 [Putridiphycobacter sp.]|nr:hypothetical protein [Putridiphycobacter sp.]
MPALTTYNAANDTTKITVNEYTPAPIIQPVDLSPLKKILEAAYDCYQVAYEPGQTYTPLDWMRGPDYALLVDAWKLFGRGQESVLSFSERIRKARGKSLMMTRIIK